MFFVVLLFSFLGSQTYDRYVFLNHALEWHTLLFQFLGSYYVTMKPKKSMPFLLLGYVTIGPKKSMLFPQGLLNSRGNVTNGKAAG